MKAYDTRERFNQLCRLAKVSGRCMVCLKDVPKRETGRPRVTCTRLECKKEYQHIYYLSKTKVRRREFAAEISAEERAARKRNGYDYREGRAPYPTPKYEHLRLVDGEAGEK